MVIPSTHDQAAFYLNVLQDILAQPTAPFHEERVAARIGALLDAWSVPFVVDDVGNIIAHYTRGAPSQPLALMAHMDHPACAITARGGPNGAQLTARLLGGVPARLFARPVGVKIFPRHDDAAATGLMARVNGYRQGETSRDIDLYLQLDDPAALSMIAVDDPGVWDLVDVEVRDGFVHARAIDDLAGCTAALLTLWRLSREQADTDAYGVFTRAEEVGLVGARALMSSGLLPRHTYIVSLEASKALPGALQGDGPVIRVGDRGVTFSEEAEVVLKAAAERLGSSVWHAAMPAKVNVQRQLMNGGHCEASAAVRLGYKATGLAFPLGNYHNVAGDDTLAPENIHVDDFLTGVALLQEAALLMPALDTLQSATGAGHETIDELTARLRSSAASIRRALAR